MPKVWILTREINEYDQDGEYFVAWFPTKPNEEQLLKYECTHLERVDWEDVWYHLREINAG
jgi:hypothetical protein